MYTQIENQMRKAARAGRIVAGAHARDEMRNDHFTVEDLRQCLLSGTIVTHQLDGDEVKYEWHGEARDGREMGLIAKLTYTGKVFVITVYWVRWF